MIEGPITDNIEALLQEISSKRLKGQWGGVLKACEKLARLCDMGLRQQDMVDKKLRVAYWYTIKYFPKTHICTSFLP